VKRQNYYGIIRFIDKKCLLLILDKKHGIEVKKYKQIRDERILKRGRRKPIIGEGQWKKIVVLIILFGRVMESVIMLFIAGFIDTLVQLINVSIVKIPEVDLNGQINRENI
jgi:hypothetical protein